MPIDGKTAKGRGSVVDVANRFLSRHYATVHPEGVDALPPDPDGEPELPGNATVYREVHARTILNRVDSPDLPFQWSLNPYQGCEHGCGYCYARPTHEYWGLGAGLDFERVVLVKRNAPELLEVALRKRTWSGEPIMLSGATDPYQPAERTERLTRRLLEVAQRFGQPVGLITKNALVMRDIDVLADMASRRLAVVAISLTTLDEHLRRVLEPRTSTAAQRLRAIASLTAAGVPVMVMVAPIIPAINQHEVPALLKAAADAGACSAGYTVLRANGAVAPLFEAWVRSRFPDRAEKVLAQVRDIHGGSLSDSRFGTRMKGEGAFAQSIARLFRIMRERHFHGRSLPPLDSSLFSPPPQGQLDLFR
jgi:DNA repair photolyase